MTFNVSILGALLPIFLVILSGYAFRRLRFPGDDFWVYAERFTYFVLFPCLLLQRTATASLNLHRVTPMAFALVAAVLTMAFLLFFIRLWWSAGSAAFTSFFQGGIRFNTYVGLSAALALFGDQGLTLAALAIAVLIPLVNLLCVTVLVLLVSPDTRNWHAVLGAIVRNPLILACVAGILLNIAGIGLHSGISDTLNIFGRASLPLGLLAVGAGLNLAALSQSGKTVMLSCILKLLVLPAFMWAASQALNVDSSAMAVAVLFAALPGSPSSYILARQLGGGQYRYGSDCSVHADTSYRYGALCRLKKSMIDGSHLQAEGSFQDITFIRLSVILFDT
jgi:predicted permease